MVPCCSGHFVWASEPNSFFMSLIHGWKHQIANKICMFSNSLEILAFQNEIGYYCLILLKFDFVNKFNKISNSPSVFITYNYLWQCLSIKPPCSYLSVHEPQCSLRYQKSNKEDTIPGSKQAQKSNLKKILYDFFLSFCGLISFLLCNTQLITYCKLNKTYY